MVVVFSWRRNWLKRVEDVPITYPTLSNPRMQSSESGITPAEKLEPTYRRGANA